MSGGMDSTATALLLKKEGHDVQGLHMRLHSGSDSSWEHARKAALEIEVHIRAVDFTKDFVDLVVTPFVRDYASGRTPSPCPMCNRFIKMTRLWDVAVSLGCEKIATGHYARTGEAGDGPALLRALDKTKDQSYFLFMLTREMLGRVLFPLGNRNKSAVRDWLKDQGISVWESEESQELCFVPDGDYRGFLKDRGIESRPGQIKDLHGEVLGTHNGITGYTVGQRRGLGICGPEPLYVAGIDPATNTVYVGKKSETYVSSTLIAGVNMLRSPPPLEAERFQVKVRSAAGGVGCAVTGVFQDSLQISYDEPQSGVAPGQAAVLYSGDRVVGGGWIEESTK